MLQLHCGCVATSRAALQQDAVRAHATLAALKHTTRASDRALQVTAAQSWCRCARVSPSLGADVAGVSPVPVQMWAGAEPGPGADVDRAEPSLDAVVAAVSAVSACRCARGEPSRGTDVGRGECPNAGKPSHHSRYHSPCHSRNLSRHKSQNQTRTIMRPSTRAIAGGRTRDSLQARRCAHFRAASAGASGALHTAAG